jgi:hypothetical protein
VAVGPGLGEGPWAQAGVQAVLFALAMFMAVSFLMGKNGGPQLVPHKWLNKDGTFYYLTLRTLADHGTLAQDHTQPRSWYEQDLHWNRELPPDWSDVAVGREGHWYPKHPVLLPLVTLPFYWAFDAWGALLVTLLCLAMIPVLSYRIGRNLVPWWAAAASAAVLASSTYLYDQSYGYSNDLFCGFLVCLAFERAFARAPEQAGVVFGLAVFGKFTNALFLPGLVMVYAMEREWRAVARAAQFALGPLGVLVALDTWMYGAPWKTGYSLILYRHNGEQAMHDHAQDFDWAGTWSHLETGLWTPGRDSMRTRAPFWLWALPGIAVALWKKPRVAVPLLVGALPLTVFVAPFKFYRVEFLDGVTGLWVPFIAAVVLVAVKAPVRYAAPVSRVRWARIGAALAALVLGGGAVVRAATQPERGYFSAHLTDAHNFIGNAPSVPCDYFNWQVQRWECSNFDRGTDAWMTGRSLSHPPRFSNAVGKQDLIELVPNPTTRRLVYESVPLTGALRLTFGLREGTRSPRVRFVVKVNGQPTELLLEAVGTLKTQSIDTSAQAGQLGTVELEVSGQGADAGVFFDGGPV